MKQKRHRKILKILSEIDVKTQEQLTDELKNSGFMVEQPSFKKYYVGMAGCGGDSNISAGSQFFIMTGDHERLDGDFPVIGKVVGGFDVVERLNDTPCYEKMIAGNIRFFTPKMPQRMKKVWVDTFGIEYEPPRTKKPTEEYLETEKEIDALIDWV